MLGSMGLLAGGAAVMLLAASAADPPQAVQAASPTRVQRALVQQPAQRMHDLVKQSWSAPPLFSHTHAT